MDDSIDSIQIFHSGEVSTRDQAKYTKNIPLTEFTEEVNEFYKKITKAFANISDENKAFKLDEIIINAEINASGKIGFLGVGAEAGVKGGISFKLKRL